MLETAEAKLVNCTQDDLYLEVGRTLVKLGTQAAPNAVAAKRSARPVLIATSEGVASVILEDSTGDAVTLNCPDRQPTTIYVVTPEVLAQFPHRTDFVAVAAYKYAELPAQEDGSEQKVVVVTRLSGRLAVASENSVNFVGVAAP